MLLDGPGRAGRRVCQEALGLLERLASLCRDGLGSLAALTLEGELRSAGPGLAGPASLVSREQPADDEAHEDRGGHE
jgi:hypothetical protein